MDTAASDFVVALEVGSYRTRCLIAEVGEDGPRIVGRGEEPSRGVRRGEVVDLAAAGYGVDRAIGAAEEEAGVEVQSLFLAAGSRHVSFFNNRACLGITREDRTISRRDVEKVLASARRLPLREDTVQIGALVCSYAVDDVRHVAEPERMRGTRLEAEVHVITDARTTVENLAACVHPERHEIEEYVFAAHAAAEAVLEPDEKKLGAALVDIGAGTTRIILYRDHAPVFSSVISIGGDHITSDVAVGMELGLADAQRLKEQHGTAGPAPIRQHVTFQRLARDGLFSADHRRLHAIVDCRVREILDIVRRELLRAGVRPASVRAVLTGGTSRLTGTDALAQQVLGCPVRVGRPRLHDGDAAGDLGPDLATAVGVLRVGARARRSQTVPVATANPAGRLMSWLRQLF
jgi:cell division protein FtsA